MNRNVPGMEGCKYRRDKSKTTHPIVDIMPDQKLEIRDFWWFDATWYLSVYCIKRRSLIEHKIQNKR